MKGAPRNGIYWSGNAKCRVNVRQGSDGLWVCHHLLGGYDNGGPVFTDDGMKSFWADLEEWTGQTGPGDAAWTKWRQGVELASALRSD